MSETQHIHDFIDEELLFWVQKFIHDRIATLRAKGMERTGQLSDSFEYEIKQAAFAEGRMLLLAFEDYGRIRDMRRIKPHEVGRDTVESLIGWVKQVGVEKFVRGFKRRRKYLPKSNDKLMRQIAWGIAKKRATGKRKRKRWYNQQKSAAINELFNEVVAKMPELVSENIAQQFPKKI